MKIDYLMWVHKFARIRPMYYLKGDDIYRDIYPHSTSAKISQVAHIFPIEMRKISFKHLKQLSFLEKDYQQYKEMGLI